MATIRKTGRFRSEGSRQRTASRHGTSDKQAPTDGYITVTLKSNKVVPSARLIQVICSALSKSYKGTEFLVTDVVSARTKLPRRRSKYQIEDLLSRVEGNARGGEFDFGKPVGKEII